jgi:hypothetical protein
MPLAQGLELLAKELKCPVWCAARRGRLGGAAHGHPNADAARSRRSLRLFSLPVTKTKCNHYFCGCGAAAARGHARFRRAHGAAQRRGQLTSCARGASRALSSCLEQSMAHKQECPMCKTPARRRGACFALAWSLL